MIAKGLKLRIKLNSLNSDDDRIEYLIAKTLEVSEQRDKYFFEIAQTNWEKSMNASKAREISDKNKIKNSPIEVIKAKISEATMKGLYDYTWKGDLSEHDSNLLCNLGYTVTYYPNQDYGHTCGTPYTIISW